jgi:hypothetical protein
LPELVAFGEITVLHRNTFRKLFILVSPREAAYGSKFQKFKDDNFE